MLQLEACDAAMLRGSCDASNPAILRCYDAKETTASGVTEERRAMERDEEKKKREERTKERNKKGVAK